MHYRSVAFPPSVFPSWLLEVAPLPERGQGAEALLCASARLPGGARKLGSITGLCVFEPLGCGKHGGPLLPGRCSKVEGTLCTRVRGKQQQRLLVRAGSWERRGWAKAAPPEGSALIQPCFQGRGTAAKTTTIF